MNRLRRALPPMWLVLVSLLATGPVVGQDEVLVQGVAMVEEFTALTPVTVIAVHSDTARSAEARTGPDGHFDLGKLPPGLYGITAFLNGVELVEEYVELESDYEFLFVIPGWGVGIPHAEVYGRYCRDESDCPADVEIRFDLVESDFERTVVTGGGGRFSMEGVPRGTYSVEARDGDDVLVEATTYLGFGDERLRITPVDGVTRESRTRGVLLSEYDGPMAGESLCFVNLHAGLEVTVTTGERGRFRLPDDLPSGVYEIRWGRGECGRSLGSFVRYQAMEIEIVAGVEMRRGDREVAAIPSTPDIPLFEWPPPRASASLVLPRGLVVSDDETDVSLWTTGQRLADALRAAGYGRWSWYAVPEGFALVSQLEQIDADGRPKDEPERWSIDVEPEEVHSLASYFRALFGARPGYFRIVVFVVTAVPFTESEMTIDRGTALEWVPGGANKLPERFREIPFGTGYDVTALVYEFRQVAEDDEPTLSDPSRTTCEQHLRRGGVWDHLPGGSP